MQCEFFKKETFHGLNLQCWPEIVPHRVGGSYPLGLSNTTVSVEHCVVVVLGSATCKTSNSSLSWQIPSDTALTV